MIELRGVHRRFKVGDQIVHALRAIDLDIDAGDYLSIMGPSGSGKSTLLHVIGLLDRPDEGEYRIDGTLTSELDDDELAALRQHKIGFVFQAFHLIGRLTAAENIELPLMLAGVAPDARRAKVDAALRTMQLEDRADHRPQQLSGGQMQRIAIARAIVMEPTIILTDEPTGNLDRRSGTDVIEALEALNRRGLALVIVTHDPEIGHRARRHLRMIDGAIEDDGVGHARR